MIRFFMRETLISVASSVCLPADGQLAARIFRIQQPERPAPRQTGRGLRGRQQRRRLQVEREAAVKDAGPRDLHAVEADLDAAAGRRLDAGEIIAEGAHGLRAVRGIRLQVDARVAVVVAGQAAEQAPRRLDAVALVQRCALEPGISLQDLQQDLPCLLYTSRCV